MRALLLDVRSGHDFGGKVKPFAQVVETLRSEGVVVPLPGELGLEIVAGGKGLARLDDLDGGKNESVGSQSCCLGRDSRRDSWCQSLGVSGG